MGDEPEESWETLEELLAELKRSGEYERLASAKADRQADEVGRLMSMVEDLSEEDVALVAELVSPAEEVSAAEREREVHRAVQRATRVEPGLEETRRRVGLTIAEVVAALVKRLRLDAAKQVKVRRYYEELEAGMLEPGRVSRQVFEALEGLLAAPPEVVSFGIRSQPSAPADSGASDEGARSDWDEVDRLFLGGY